VSADVFCVFTNRTPATAMRGFGVTGADFAIECQMDKLAQLIGMDPIEFRINNAYRDGDMKAHRREAKNCALIECCQVAAEKAGWPIHEEFARMSSRQGGGGDRARIEAAPRETGRPEAEPPRYPSYERPAPPPEPAPQAPEPPRAAPVTRRFSSVFGTRRR
jgi:Molybdopterin-binding domain of aldehyde dehydrogenase